MRGPPGDIDRSLSITVRAVVGAPFAPPAVLTLRLASFFLNVRLFDSRSSLENPAVDAVSLLSGENGVVHLYFISPLAKTEGSRFRRRQFVSRCFKPRLEL